MTTSHIKLRSATLHSPPKHQTRSEKGCTRTGNQRSRSTGHRQRVIVLTIIHIVYIIVIVIGRSRRRRRRTWSRAPLSVERIPRHERCVITRIPMTFLNGFTLFHSIGPIRVIFHVPHRKVIPNRTREPPILNDGVYFERSEDEFLVGQV